MINLNKSYTHQYNRTTYHYIDQNKKIHYFESESLSDLKNTINTYKDSYDFSNCKIYKRFTNVISLDFEVKAYD